MCFGVICFYRVWLGGVDFVWGLGVEGLMGFDSSGGFCIVCSRMVLCWVGLGGGCMEGYW